MRARCTRNCCSSSLMVAKRRTDVVRLVANGSQAQAAPGHRRHPVVDPLSDMTFSQMMRFERKEEISYGQGREITKI